MSKKSLLKTCSVKPNHLLIPQATSSRLTNYHSQSWSSKTIKSLKPPKSLKTDPQSLISPQDPEPSLKNPSFISPNFHPNKEPTSKSSKILPKNSKPSRNSLPSIDPNPKPKPKILINNKSVVKKSKIFNQKHFHHTSTQSMPQHEILVDEFSELFNKPLPKSYLLPSISQVPGRSSKKKKTCVSAKFHNEIEEITNISKISEFNSDSEDSDDLKPMLMPIAQSLFSNILELCIGRCLDSIVYSAQSEILSAYLSLSSSKILYNLVNQVLDSCIPKIVELAYIEESEAEYTGIRDDVFIEFYEQQLHSLIDDFSLTQISLEIMKDYAKLLPIQEIAKECINEEIQWINNTAEEIYQNLVGLALEMENTEVLVEDEIGKIKIEEIWKIFPKSLMKDMKEIKKNGMFERLAEFVWQDFLNEDLAGFWVKEIVEIAIDEVVESEDGGKVIGGWNED